jgi:hypothetical protein
VRGRARERREQAKDDAARLIEARNALARVISDSEIKGHKLRGHTQNPGDQQKMEFVTKLAEAWACLRSRCPSASPEARFNPFLRLVKASWLDAGISRSEGAKREEDFTRAMQRARAALTSERVRHLRNSGPDW